LIDGSPQRFQQLPQALAAHARNSEDGPADGGLQLLQSVVGLRDVEFGADDEFGRCARVVLYFSSSPRMMRCASAATGRLPAGRDR